LHRADCKGHCQGYIVCYCRTINWPTLIKVVNLVPADQLRMELNGRMQHDSAKTLKTQEWLNNGLDNNTNYSHKEVSIWFCVVKKNYMCRNFHYTITK
jgi:hypothetical protein